MKALVLLLAAALALGIASTSTVRAQPADTLSAVTLNIWHDRDDWSRRLPVILDTLRTLDPDVICLQEVLQNEGLPNQADTIADSLGYRRTFSSVDGPDSPKRYGNAILVRHPFARSDMRKLEPLDDFRTAAYARVEVGERPLDVYCTHLHHTQEGGEIRATQLRDLLGFVRDTRMPGAPVLLAGDFNAAPDAPELRPLAETFADAYAATHPEQVGVLVTTLNPALGHTPRRIDYLFHDRVSGLTPVDARILFTEPTADGTWASDHFGVLARFAWPR
jgi:endonuclease/exonuclease/phosphatase family metal-dependent hydrolase